MGYATRQPTDNDPPTRCTGNPWLGETDQMDLFVLLLNGLVKICAGCSHMTNIRYLQNGICPDCRTKTGTP